MPHESHAGGWLISDDPARFDLPRAHAWIARESYWSQGVPFEVFARAVVNSLTIGAYGPDGDMRAMARVVTDRATFAWLCDVFVDVAARGDGLGKHLVGYVRGHPDLQGLRRLLLATRDAHGLYAGFGFAPLAGAERWMEIHDPSGFRG